MVADKAQCKAVGESLTGLIMGFKNGKADEIENASKAFMAALNAADDIKGDTDAAVPFIAAGLLESYGDTKVGP